MVVYGGDLLTNGWMDGWDGVELVGWSGLRVSE